MLHLLHYTGWLGRKILTMDEKVSTVTLLGRHSLKENMTPVGIDFEGKPVVLHMGFPPA